MSRLAPYTEIRRHPRAQLQLPVRIRWRGPFGMRLEITHTYDASREGLLVYRIEACELETRVWVAFPFDSTEAMIAQPETPARVVRVERVTKGAYRVALHLESPPRTAPRPRAQERRASVRVPFSLPIFVRAAGTPWPEESMTQDISHTGARFLTARIFSKGDQLLATISWGEWARAGEIPARIVRVVPQPDSSGGAPLADPENGLSAMFTSVAIQWEKPAKT
jgi:PilZ domain-containing protein